MEYEIGATACYINDYSFTHIADIPVEVAVEWVKKVTPETRMSATGNVQAKDLTVGGDPDTDANVNGWLNKLFVLIACDHGKWVALYNHDGRFSIRDKAI
jgi:hypothetical protein